MRVVTISGLCISTKNEFRDTSIGRDYCYKYLEFEANCLRTGNGPILGLIFEDMMFKMDRGTIARSFIYTLVESMGWIIQHPDFFDELGARLNQY